MKLLVAALLVALLPGRAQAQRTPPGDTTAGRDSARSIEAVRVRAAYTPRVVGSASTVSLEPDSTPLAVTSPTMSEALRRLPFLVVRQNSRGETELSVRGSEARQAAVLFDGVPLSLSWDARADVSAVPLSGVQRMEFVRGLSSLLAGPNAIGGVIATSMWTDHDPLQRPERTSRVDVQGDQFGGTRLSALAGAAVVHSPERSLTVRSGAGWRDQPGIARARSLAEPGTTDRLRLNSDARSYDGFLGARFENARGSYLAGLVSAITAERGVVPELHITTPRLWRNPEVSRQIGTLTAGTGAIFSRLGVGDVEGSLGVTTGSVEIDAYADRAYRQVTGTELGDDRTLSARLTFDQTIGEHVVLRGAATRADIRYDETIGSDPSVRYVQRLTSVGTELDVLPTRFLTISGGIAADAATTPEAGGREPLGRQDGIGWRSGATWFLPAAAMRLHTSVSSRRRFPSLRELYSGALGRFAPNPTLRPETVRGGEVGVTFTRIRYDGQVVAFTSRTDDALVRVTLPDGRFQRVNRDRFSSHGVEMTGGTALGPVQLRGDLTLQRARITDRTLATSNARRPEDVPMVFGSVAATGDLPYEVNGMTRLRALGSTYCTHPDFARLEQQGGAYAMDVGIERRWTLQGWLQRVRTSVALDNVTDRAIYDRCGLPQAGRTLRIGFGVG